MKIYDKLVDKLSRLMDYMLGASKFTGDLVLAAFDLCADLLKAGRAATRISFLVMILSSVLAAASHWQIFHYILLGSMIFFNIVLVVRFLSLLVWDATKKLIGMK